MVSPGNRGSGRWRVAICVGAVNGFGPPAWEFGDGQDWAVSRSAGVARDPHGRWSLERRAVSVQRRTVDSLIAYPACPGCVPAAVAQACLVADQDLVRAERVAVGASRGTMRDPLPGRGLHEVADRPIKPGPRGNRPRSGFSVGGGATNKAGRDHLNGRNKQTMTEQPSAGLPDQFRELATENEKRMKAIQDQIANQLEAQRKAVADLVESQQKAFADFLEQQRSVKITDHWEAQRKAISEQIEHQRKAFTDLVERQWTAQKKAIEDAQHAIVGIFRPKPDEPKPDE